MRAPLGAFGKLASRAEYVRCNASTPSFRALDDFLTDNVEAGAGRATAAEWTAWYPRGKVHVFVFNQPGVETLLAGALCPSHDSAGRGFPFVVASELAPQAAHLEAPELVPLWLEDLWKDAHRLVVEAVTGGTLSSSVLESRTASLPAGIEEAASNYEEWTREVRLSQLEGLLYGTEKPGTLRDAISGLVDAVRPHRGIEPPRTRLSLRLPLGRCGGAAVCFWLAAVRRVAGWKRVLPSFFWTHDKSGGHLLVHLGKPASSTLGQLWLPSATADDVCDLTRVASTTRTPLLPQLDRILNEASHSVSELLVELGDP